EGLESGGGTICTSSLIRCKFFSDCIDNCAAVSKRCRRSLLGWERSGNPVGFGCGSQAARSVLVCSHSSKASVASWNVFNDLPTLRTRRINLMWCRLGTWLVGNSDSPIFRNRLLTILML